MPEGRFVGGCYRCKSEVWLPLDLYTACKHSSKIGFFCPYGHEQIFAEGETEETKLRRERDQLKQNIAFWEQETASARRERDEAKKLASSRRTALIKTRKLAGAGVCPCCHRSVRQMALHMKSKHPKFNAEEVK